MRNRFQHRHSLLWGGGTLPQGSDLPQVPGTTFRLIKAYEPERDGYHWLKGVALVRHEGSWVASFGHNTCERGENNATEVANARVSHDNGWTWGPLSTIAAPPGELAASHGVFMVHDGELWAFLGSFHGRGRAGGRVHTRAYVATPGSVQEGRPAWIQKGVVARDGFWPLQEPVPMENGNYIVAGVSIGGGEGGNTIPAVARVNGVDVTDWQVIRLPYPAPIWGESTVIVNGEEVLLISRSNRHMLKALVATSSDYGKTWGPLVESNLPMADSKPYAGTLSDGRPYLLNTICGDIGTAGRNPLSLLIADEPGAPFQTACRVIDSRRPPDGAGGYTSWPYPYAVEWQGHLWIGIYMGTAGRHASGAAGLIRLPLATV